MKNKSADPYFQLGNSRCNDGQTEHCFCQFHFSQNRRKVRKVHGPRVQLPGQKPQWPLSATARVAIEQRQSVARLHHNTKLSTEWRNANNYLFLRIIWV
jgi:hypothetical protein